MQNVLGTWPADTVEKAQEKRARDSLEQTLQTALMLAVGAFQGVLGVAGVPGNRFKHCVELGPSNRF